MDAVSKEARTMFADGSSEQGGAEARPSSTVTGNLAHRSLIRYCPDPRFASAIEPAWSPSDRPAAVTSELLSSTLTVAALYQALHNYVWRMLAETAQRTRSGRKRGTESDSLKLLNP
jgi:hypothetical protein